jgi:hypothetical protein
VKRTVVTLVAKTFCDWLDLAFPPSGGPAIPMFLARSLDVIKALPEGEPEALDEGKVAEAAEWLFRTLVESDPGDDWAMIACHALRLHALEAAPEILHMIAAAKTLDSGSEIKGL